MSAPDTIRLVPGDDWNVAIETRDEGGLTDISSWTVTYARVELPAGGGFEVTIDLTTPNLARLTCDKAVNGDAENGIRVGASVGLLRVRAVSPGGDDRTIVFKRVIGVPINSDREATTYFLGIQGLRGFSAYEVALANGFESSEAEWLDSLVGWTPVVAGVVVDERRVHQVVDWLGSGAEKPVTGLYIGPAGFVATAAEATDVRGGTGDTGDQGDPGPQGPAGDGFLRWACSDETTPIALGNGKVTDRMPYAFTATGIRASLVTAQASGSIFTVDVKKNGVSVLSTLITIDNTEKTSVTAATPPVLSTTTFADDDEIRFDVTQIGNGTAAGLKVTLLGNRTP